MIATLRTKLQIVLTGLRRRYLRHVWGMKIGKATRISGKAFLDFTNPQGIHIGDYSIVTPGARIFTHDFVHEEHRNTFIGSNCFIGANAIIQAGIRIGDHCIIAAGSVVISDIPDRCMAAGNPARIVRTDIKTGIFGMINPSSPGYG